MKVTTEKPEPGVATLTVEVPPEDLDKAVDGAWRRLANRVNIPGFRRGKAPRPLVERHVGAAAIDEEALRRLLPERYDAAVEEAGIAPIDRPSFDIVQLERGKPLVFKATVPLRPTVDLGDYKSITVEPEAVAVTDEEVDRVLERLREGQVQWLPVEDRGVEMGDQVIADITIQFPPKDGEESRPSERKDSEVIVGENGYPDGFDQQLLGAKPGDTREIQLSWEVAARPADAAAEAESAAPETRSATFTVHVKDLKRKEMPALDDAFAKSLGEHDTLDELKQDVRRRLHAEALRAARTAVENKAVDAAIEKATFEIPERLVDLETDAMAEDRRQTLAQQQITLERYLSIVGTSEEDWRKELREQALRQVKARLVLDQVAEHEGLTVSPEEVQREIEVAAQSYGDQAPEVLRSLSTADGIRRISTSLRRHKSIESLVGYGGGYPADEYAGASEGSETQGSETASSEPEGGEAGAAPAAGPQPEKAEANAS